MQVEYCLYLLLRLRWLLSTLTLSWWLLFNLSKTLFLGASKGNRSFKHFVSSRESNSICGLRRFLADNSLGLAVLDDLFARDKLHVFSELFLQFAFDSSLVVLVSEVKVDGVSERVNVGQLLQV